MAQPFYTYNKPLIMKKFLIILCIAGAVAACNTNERTGDPTGTRGLDTTQPLLGPRVDTVYTTDTVMPGL